jgi:hypothetical protein
MLVKFCPLFTIQALTMQFCEINKYAGKPKVALLNFVLGLNVLK